MVNGKDQALVTNPLIIDFTSLAVFFNLITRHTGVEKF